jgi:endonuclease VIII
MPEGHLVHRHARDLADRLGSRSIDASSPQGRFAEGAAAVNGRVLAATEAFGKHLFLSFGDDAAAIVHVHLGRQGLWLWSDAPSSPQASVRLRLAADHTTADLIAPLVCELGDPQLRDDVVSTVGPDPLRDDADAEAVRSAVRASRQAIGALLLDQSVLSGIGNVLRAELLNMVGVYPTIPGADVGDDAFDALWSTTGSVMRRARDEGRIITRRPPGVPAETLGEVEGRFVYGRQTCGRCGSALDRLEVAGRAINACPVCQPLP